MPLGTQGEVPHEGHDPEDRLGFVKSRISIVEVDGAVAEEAADVKVRHRLHIVDAIALASSKDRGANLVTGDKHFRGIPGVVMLLD